MSIKSNLIALASATLMVVLMDSDGIIIDHKMVDPTQYFEQGAELVLRTNDVTNGTRTFSYAGKNKFGYDIYFVCW